MTYAQKKTEIRQMAIDYQTRFADGDTFYWSDIAEWTAFFMKYGKRYGLLTEFRENGII